jgi:hypothetical protein
MIRAVANFARSTVTAARRRNTHLLIAGLICVTASACAEGAPATSGTTRAATPPPGPTASPTRSVEFTGPRYPNLSRFTDALDRFTYTAAYDDCGVVGLRSAAEAYGGDTTDPASVARAYATATYSQATSYREAAYQGCLDALAR